MLNPDVMRRVVLAVVINAISLAVLGRTALLCDNIDGESRKEEIRTLAKTIALIKTMNVKSELLFDTKLSVLKMKPEARRTVKALRGRNLTLSDGLYSLRKELDYLLRSSESKSSEYCFCEVDSAGNLQHRNIPIILQQIGSSTFDGNLYVTVNKKGRIEDVKVVSEDLHRLPERLDDCFKPGDNRDRRFLLDWIARLQTLLITHDMDGMRDYLKGVLLVSVKDSSIVYDRKECDMFLLDSAFFPYDVDIRNHPNEKYCMVSMKVGAMSSDRTEIYNILVIVDFRLSGKPYPLVFAWIEPNVGNLDFNNIRLR